MKINTKTIKNAMLIFGVGSVAMKLISRSRVIYKERQGNLSADFPEIENEINEAVEAVISEREENADE